ncbi:hypothetical protein Tco_1197537 [Tanacetum coccineum]
MFKEERESTVLIRLAQIKQTTDSDAQTTDPGAFKKYTELCERNVIPRFSADISKNIHDNNVSNTHSLDNEAANGLFVQSGGNCSLFTFCRGMFMFPFDVHFLPVSIQFLPKLQPRWCTYSRRRICSCCYSSLSFNKAISSIFVKRGTSEVLDQGLMRYAAENVAFSREAEEGLGRKRVDLRSLCSTSGTFFRQGSGHFMTNEDGTLTYNGGETNAANVTSETLFSDLKLSLAKIFHAWKQAKSDYCKER